MTFLRKRRTEEDTTFPATIPQNPTTVSTTQDYQSVNSMNSQYSNEPEIK